VFVAARGGVRIRRVTVGGASADSVVISGGLAAGERVVVAGVSELAALAAAN